VSAFIIPLGTRACSEIVLPPGPARPVPKPCIVCRILYGWDGDGCAPEPAMTTILYVQLQVPRPRSPCTVSAYSEP
jgi:hypothetical protein